MKKCCWYFGKAGRDDFDRDAANMARCGLGTLIADGSEPGVLDPVARAAKANGIQTHIFFTMPHLCQEAFGAPAPDVVWSDPAAYQALYKPGATPHKFQCWPFIEDFSPLARCLEKFFDKNPLVTGVNLDLLRYPNTAMSEKNPCQCSGCRARRLPWLGHECLTAEDLGDPSIMYMEVATRVELLTRVLRAISEATHRRRVCLSISARNIYVGRDVEYNPPPTWGYGPAIFEGQDWIRWAREKLVNVLHFMNYSTTYERFERFARQHVGFVGDTSAELYEGMGISSSAGKMPLDVMRRQLDLVKDIGLHGVTIFPWQAMTEEYLRVLEKA